MNVRKRPRLELELNSGSASAAPPALLTTTAHSADLSEALLGASGNQSLILTSAGNALLNSSSGAQIILTICGDENSEDGEDYYAIKQEPGSDLDVHTLLPTNLQLPTGCEIYLVKDTSLASQPKPSIKLEPELLGEKMVASRPVTLSVAAAPAPAPAPAPVPAAAASGAASSATSVLYGQTQRSLPEVVSGVNGSVVPTTPASKLEAYKKRDDKRRATHNEVERRRRDKINSWIFKLKEMLPSLSSNGSSTTGEASPSPSTSTSTSCSAKSNLNLNPNPNPSPSGRTPPNDSKSQILIKACEYIKSMQGEIDTLRDCLREADGLRASNQALREELDRLKRQQQMQERFHTAAGTRSTFNVTLNSLNSSATSDLFEGMDTTPNLAAVSSLGFGKRGLLISDYDE